VALAQNEGKINLTLRNPLDVDPTTTAGAQVAGLLGKQTTPPDLTEKPKARPRPVRAIVLPPPVMVDVKPLMVETIRAAKRTEEPIR
jgi:hypothetical protein